MDGQPIREESTCAVRARDEGFGVPFLEGRLVVLIKLLGVHCAREELLESLRRLRKGSPLLGREESLRLFPLLLARLEMDS